MARRYAPEEKERGMMAVILNHGSYTKAARDLDAAGVDVPPKTLEYWAKTYTDEMDRLSHELAPQMKERRAKMLDEVVVAATEVAMEGVNVMRGRMSELDLRDVPGATRNMQTTAAIAADKSRDLRGDGQEKAPAQPLSVTLNFLERKGLIQVESEDVVVDAKEIEG